MNGYEALQNYSDSGKQQYSGTCPSATLSTNNLQRGWLRFEPGTQIMTRPHILRFINREPSYYSNHRRCCL